MSKDMELGQTDAKSESKFDSAIVPMQVFECFNDTISRLKEKSLRLVPLAYQSNSSPKLSSNIREWRV